ncbi:hypothetical protein JTB14_033016 [Gonioctena quinquepunctata]|nr:hypothetical protein JTB14_033016 [Gonioctena quinquepunctata]
MTSVCHLATLLKTAEELRIKGLAEVSWRDEEQPTNVDSNSNGVQTAIPQVQAVMPTSPTPSSKRKRGRPPIDDYDQAFTTPKIMAVTGAQDDAYSNDAMSSSEHDLNIWEEDQSGADNTENEESPVKVKKEVHSPSNRSRKRNSIHTDMVSKFNPFCSLASPLGKHNLLASQTEKESSDTLLKKPFQQNLTTILMNTTKKLCDDKYFILLTLNIIINGKCILYCILTNDM